jgi:hypothetical protein
MQGQKSRPAANQDIQDSSGSQCALEASPSDRPDWAVALDRRWCDSLPQPRRWSLASVMTSLLSRTFALAVGDRGRPEVPSLLSVTCSLSSRHRHTNCTANWLRRFSSSPSGLMQPGACQPGKKLGEENRSVWGGGVSSPKQVPGSRYAEEQQCVVPLASAGLGFLQ